MLTSKNSKKEVNENRFISKKKNIINFRLPHFSHLITEDNNQYTRSDKAQALRTVITELVNLFDSLRYLTFSTRCACSQFPL